MEMYKIAHTLIHVVAWCGIAGSTMLFLSRASCVLGFGVEIWAWCAALHCIVRLDCLLCLLACLLKLTYLLTCRNEINPHSMNKLPIFFYFVRRPVYYVCIL